MSWIENVRNKPHDQKVRIIWIISIVVTALLIILWVATSKISKKLPKDTTLFQVIGKGIQDTRKSFHK